MKLYQLQPAGTQAEQAGLPIVRRNAAGSTVPIPKREGGEAAPARPGIASVRIPYPEACKPPEPVPVWLGVLMAASCKARRNGENHAVRWSWISGRAVYTNAGRDTELIEPLGVSLLGGHTMAVCWMPGETTYTVEVYRQEERCA